MLFNTWHGQMRPKANAIGEFYYRPKRPVGKIQLRRLKEGGESVEYRADDRGNMEVFAPEHIHDFVNLGYPIYCGVFAEKVALPSGQFRACPNYHFLVWQENPEYGRRVMEGLNRFLDSKAKKV